MKACLTNRLRFGDKTRYNDEGYICSEYSCDTDYLEITDSSYGDFYGTGYRSGERTFGGSDYNSIIINTALEALGIKQI